MSTAVEFKLAIAIVADCIQGCYDDCPEHCIYCRNEGDVTTIQHAKDCIVLEASKIVEAGL